MSPEDRLNQVLMNHLDNGLNQILEERLNLVLAEHDLQTKQTKPHGPNQAFDQFIDDLSGIVSDVETNVEDMVHNEARAEPVIETMVEKPPTH